MTYEEIVGKALVVYAKADAKAITGHVAIQFNVSGEGEGAFYLEVSDGKVDIQPYEYYDRNAIVYVPSNVLIDILDAKLTLSDAYNDNKLSVEGDLGAVLLLEKIVLKKPVKKVAAKKTAAPKKETAKKAEAPKKAAAPKKETVKKAEAPKKEEAKKAEAPKKETVKKEVAPKAEVKAEVKAEAKTEVKAPAKKAPAKAAAKKTTK